MDASSIFVLFLLTNTFLAYDGNRLGLVKHFQWVLQCMGQRLQRTMG